MADSTRTAVIGSALSIFKTRTPVILQAEANECALACLCMVTGFHGCHTSLAELRNRQQARDLLSLEQVIDIASSLHLETRAFRCEPDDLAQLQTPLILHVDFDHYVVLESMTSRSANLIDPASGRVSLTRKSFSERFTGIALELLPSTSFRKTGNKRDFPVLKLIRQLPISRYAGTLGLVFTLSILVQVLALMSPLFLQIVVDEVLVPASQDIFSVLLTGFAFIYLAGAALRWLRGLLVIQAGNQLSYVLSAGLHRHLLNLPLTFFSRRTVGDVVSRFSSLQPVQQFITTGAVSIILDGLMVVFALVLLTGYSPGIALYALFLTVVYLALQSLLMIPYRSHSHEHIHADAKVHSHFIESIQSIESISRSGASQVRASEWLNQLVTSINAQVRAARYGLGIEVCRYLLTGFLLLGTVALAVKDVAAATISLGMLYAIAGYCSHLSTALVSLAAEWQSFQMLGLHGQRLADLTETSEDQRTTLNPGTRQVDIRLQDVGFTFDGQSLPLLSDLDIDIRCGDKVAIMGQSGSGKSTLLKLLLAEEQPSTGSIRIAGTPLQKGLTTRHCFSLLSPSDQIISGTISDNITYRAGIPDLERQALCAGVACLHEDILRFPMTYQEKITEQGHKLSAGQRQRLLLARALYRPAPVLLLDEATSHLDPAMELDVMKNVLADPRTCIFVTHRQSVAQLANRVINLDHDELPAIAAGG